MWPPPKSTPAVNRTVTPPHWLLVDAPTAAAALSVSERTFHSLRKRPDFPQGCTVVLGSRCVRFRLDALHTFVKSVAAAPRAEPKQLQQSRKCRADKRARVSVEKAHDGPDANDLAETTSRQSE
jgi:hypothetical protein